ncbi:MAG: adenylate kinase [Clostridiales bacterium GWB2_37_7]|nr:MAG: adenylate kinase [Clostridiales bacterium GWB2_37_7]
MRIVLLGSPGSGKGTQASRIIGKYNIPHISTGDIFRDNIKRQTSIGLEAKKFIDKGHLVPDDLTLKIIEDRFIQPDCAEGFLLDGFPRTIVQAEALELELQKNVKKLDAVVNLDVHDEAIISRMTGRRVCSKCGATYNLTFNKPTVDNICDKCGGALLIREDDKLETVTNRLKVYKTETQPLIDFYKQKGILITVNGELDAEVVFQNICNALEQF